MLILSPCSARGLLKCKQLIGFARTDCPFLADGGSLNSLVGPSRHILNDLVAICVLLKVLQVMLHRSESATGVRFEPGWARCNVEVTDGIMFSLSLTLR